MNGFPERSVLVLFGSLGVLTWHGSSVGHRVFAGARVSTAARCRFPRARPARWPRFRRSHLRAVGRSLTASAGGQPCKGDHDSERKYTNVDSPRHFHLACIGAFRRVVTPDGEFFGRPVAGPPRQPQDSRPVTTYRPADHAKKASIERRGLLRMRTAPRGQAGTQGLPTELSRHLLECQHGPPDVRLLVEQA